MANSLYAKAKRAFRKKKIDLSADTIKAVILDSASYTPDLTNDEFFSDIPSGAVKGNSGGNTGADGTTLTTPTVSAAGVFDADDAVISAMSAGTYEYVCLYLWTGNAATSYLIALYDTLTGFPVTVASGGAVDIVWDNGSNKILA